MKRLFESLLPAAVFVGLSVTCLTAAFARCPASGSDHPGLAIYTEHCARCHGETEDAAIARLALRELHTALL